MQIFVVVNILMSLLQKNVNPSEFSFFNPIRSKNVIPTSGVRKQFRKRVIWTPPSIKLSQTLVYARQSQLSSEASPLSVWGADPAVWRGGRGRGRHGATHTGRNVTGRNGNSLISCYEIYCSFYSFHWMQFLLISLLSRWYNVHDMFTGVHFNRIYTVIVLTKQQVMVLHKI